MPEPDPAHVELAALIRGALVLSDHLRLLDVSIGLDEALNRLAERDVSGTIARQPFDGDDFERLFSPDLPTRSALGDADASHPGPPSSMTVRSLRGDAVIGLRPPRGTRAS